MPRDPDFLPQNTAEHWAFIQKLIQRTGTSVVVPIYKLAPLNTADAFTESAMELLLDVSQDTRYPNAEIVLAGDSAGGWITLRLIEALCEAALKGVENAESALSRTTSALMLSPLVNLEITDEIREADRDVSESDEAAMQLLMMLAGPLVERRPDQCMRPTLVVWHGLVSRL